MAILKKEYELSVWDETLGVKGQKEETKRAIIGAHDMTYDGRATALKLSRKINGTNVLTFQMPSKYFNSELGEYIHNEFCDYIFNERKLKLKYDGEWFEFYVKNISENKQFKSIMYQYQCEDAFIDELSRNGYGITFDTELYNNVEEIGVFTEQILEDSIWEYDASKNWGDFTEYAEEKLFKIPVSMFNKIVGYKLNYDVSDAIEDEKLILTNVFSGETRNLELGDDLSREKKIFWDNGNFDSGISLLKKLSENIPNDGYIYVPYSCLDFCYISNNKDGEGFAATEEPVIGEIKGVKSYYLTPKSIDPTYLIQFIAIPQGIEVQIDEAGLLVNKDYSYVMTLADWNNNVNTNIYYDLEKKKMEQSLVANKVVGYNGYLEKIGDTDISFGKRISITDRTEINISEDIDQYVVVYNNSQKDFVSKGMFTSEEWINDDLELDYRICSHEATRMIIPQLARNLVQNGTEMTDTSGWEVMKTLSEVGSISSSIAVRPIEENDETQSSTGGLLFLPQCSKMDETVTDKRLYKTFINFGIVGQEEEIQKEQTYVLRLTGMGVAGVERKNEDGIKITNYESNASIKTEDIKIIIGEGGYDSEGDYTITETIVIENITNGQNYFIRPKQNIKNPYIAIQFTGLDGGKYKNDKQEDIICYYNLKELIFAKAYTKGVDFFNSDNNKGIYKYTGRDIFFDKYDNHWIEITGGFWRTASKAEFLSETDIVEGDVYTYKKYFRQQIQAKKEIKDSFMLKSYLNNNIEKNGFDSTKYTEEDLKIVTDYIDLNKCSYYNSYATAEETDCNHPKSTNGLCMYQKYGYCPYQFQTQKHCRKIRTLNGEKSNRFNLTQELSKIFEIYPIYYIEHKNNGKIITDIIKDEEGQQYEKMRKKVFYITEKGIENKLGFRYEKNLSNISRTFDSKEIVTKLYVEDVDSEVSKTGLCSIKTAEDNPSKDNYIIDFSYYTMRGFLDETATNADLYGVDSEDMGYLKKLGYYNNEYDRLSNLIINLQDESYTELEANVEVNLTGIETAQKELNKIKKNMTKYSTPKKNNTGDKEASETYNNYKTKYNEQKTILLGLVKDTFMKDGEYDKNLPVKYEEKDVFWSAATNAEELLDNIVKYGFKKFKEDFLDTFKYQEYGLMGQFTAEYLQIQEWKKQRAKYLKDINRISLDFYQKYEPYLKEGTWSDSNYLTDNTYYFGAKEVAKQGAIPKLTYNISVIDLSIFDEDYKIGIADSTYIEDIETFGINQKTGLPNRLKAIVSGMTYDLDIPTQNSIEIQNYTTQFEDLFQQVSASVQSLSFNENIYKRSSNFTATKNISKDSLQGGLLENQLTLLETDEKNISLDQTGQSGSDINNHANQYKLSGEGLFFSNNGGQTWNVGVTPKGINADYINVGSLDASKISIVDGNYLYFLWDKGGITAYREPQATKEGGQYFQDFARFNKYGLSLVEDGKIKLRAGYEYKTDDANAEGKIIEEKDITGDTNIGFYLYNDKGQVIFKTESGENTARLSLTGEIFVNGEFKKIVEIDAGYTYSDLTKKLGVREVSFNLAKENKSTQAILSYKVYKEDTSELTETTLKQIVTSVTDQKIVYISNGEISENTITGFKVMIILLNEKNYYIGDNLYSKKAYSFLYQPSAFNQSDNTWEVVPDTEAKEFYYTYDLIYEITPTKSTKLIFDPNTNFKDTFLTKEKVTAQDVVYYELNSSNNEYTKKIAKNKYKVKQGIGYALYDKKIENQETSEEEEGVIGIFINNQSDENNTEQVSSENEDKDTSKKFRKRLMCCAQMTPDAINNIFSILDDGGLYMGGEIVPKEKTTGDLHSKLESLSDDIYIDIEGDKGDNTIIIKDGEIKIGGEDLVQGIVNTLGEQIDEIRAMVQGAGLVPHTHDIGGKEVTSKHLDGNDSNDATLSSSDGYVIENIVVKGKYKGSPFTNITPRKFLECLALQIKEGLTTGETGTGLSSGTTGTVEGYVVTNEGD